MNNKITRKLNQCRLTGDPIKAFNKTGEEIVDAHNFAVANGFLDLPLLEFKETEYNEHINTITVTPKSNVIRINELYGLQTAWGADDITVITCDGGCIELSFKRQ